MELETRQVIEEEDSLVGLFERAEQVLGHIASDLEKVDDEKKVIDDEIVKITEDVQEEKKQLLSKQQILEMERDDLLAKLREKESELDQCSKEVDITQAKINKAAKMFERDLRRLKERRENIINEREQREKDHYNLQMKKLALEHRRQKLIEEDAHYKLILSQVSEHIIGAEKASRRLESYCSQRNKWLAMESKHNNDVRSLHMKLASANEKLDAESLEIVKFEEDIVKANQKILSNETTISGLNTEKVIAVKAKNFKKASQLSKEIKELEELNKGIRDSVAEFEATVEERKKVMEKEIRNRDLIEAELSLVEKKSDHIRYEALVSMEQEISLILEDLKESSPGRSYESDFLSEQLSDFRRELDRMRDKYGWDATSVTTADMNSIENIEEQGTTSEAALAEDLKQQIAKKKTMLEDFQMTLAEFEEKQAVAVEDEDYELADEIQTKIDVVNENISSAVEELEELERRLHSFGLNSARSVESGSIESHNSIEENQSEVICEENDGDTENVVVNEARISSVISSTEGLEKEISDLGTVLSEINENEEPEKAQEIRDHINQIQKLIDTPKSELEE